MSKYNYDADGKVKANQQEHAKKYAKTHYDRVEVNLPKGYKDIFIDAAKDKALEQGITYGKQYGLSRFMFEAVCAQLGIDPEEHRELPLKPDND